MNKDKPNHTSEHLANERTFLAWMRTSIALMGFGFILVKFSLFLKQIPLVAEAKNTVHAQNGHSSLVGIVIVIVGAIVLLFSYINYYNNKKRINNNTF